MKQHQTTLKTEPLTTFWEKSCLDFIDVLLGKKVKISFDNWRIGDESMLGAEYLEDHPS